MILVFSDDQYHPGEVVRRGLAEVAPAMRFEAAPDGPYEGDLAGADAVVLAKMNVRSSTDATPWTDDAAGTAIRQFVEAGKGLLVIHAGTVGYGPLRSLVGGAFVRHPESCPVMVEPIPDQPLSEGVSPFEVRDEHYFMDVDDGVNVFLQTRSAHGVQPAGWTLTPGAGRVCVLTPGHFAPVWDQPEFRRLLANALKWVTNA